MKIMVDGETRLSIRFCIGVSPFNAGEQAGFREDFAHELVARGVCEYVDPADGPARALDRQFLPGNDQERAMLAEVARLMTARTMSRTERGTEDVIWGEARWDRTLKDFFWPKGQGPGE